MWMENEFVKDVMTFKSEYIYNQPYVNRQLSGLLRYINDFAEDNVESLTIMNK